LLTTLELSVIESLKLEHLHRRSHKILDEVQQSNPVDSLEGCCIWKNAHLFRALEEPCNSLINTVIIFIDCTMFLIG
jgi:hypothetical protein